MMLINILDNHKWYQPPHAGLCSLALKKTTTDRPQTVAMNYPGNQVYS